MASIRRNHLPQVGSVREARALAARARASGLPDRGEIAPGQRADLLLIDWPEGGIPVVRQTWVGGRCAYAAQTPAAV